MTAFPDVFARIEARTIDPAGVRAAFERIFAGEWTSVQIGAFATALRMHGEDGEMIAEAARALRAMMTPVEHGLATVVDTCGTGGDGAHTVNVSTAAAVVVAACGVPVAKHGNRSVSSKCGSADVVEALGIPLDTTAARHAEILRATNITFMMAPAHHPALRHAAVARRELGVRTIFNALGPLVNPARTTHQLVGVYEDRLRPLVANALGRVGVVRAWVVRAEDGLDEISPEAPTRVSVLEDGVVRERVIGPSDFGEKPSSVDALKGGDASENAAALAAVIEGKDHGAAPTVVMNAAAVLAIARGSADLVACAKEAREAIASGAARRTLEAWRAAAAGPGAARP